MKKLLVCALTIGVLFAYSNCVFAMQSLKTGLASQSSQNKFKYQTGWADNFGFLNQSRSLSSILPSNYDVSGFDFDQLVVARSLNNEVLISFWQKDSEKSWTEVFQEISGFVGKQGIGTASENSVRTPLGLYRLGPSFGTESKGSTAREMNYFQITNDDYWVDDPGSKYYNQHVRRVDDTDNDYLIYDLDSNPCDQHIKKDWKSAEHLADYPFQYGLGVFIQYNVDPVIPENGSAIFLHVAKNHTAGCVGMPKEQMEKCMQWLNKSKNPHIIIFNS